MKLDKYRKYLEKTYKDKLFLINNYVTVKNDDGTEDAILEPSKSEPVACRLSIMKPDEEDIKNMELDSEVIKYKIFCSPDVVVEKGDKVEVHKMVNNSVEIITGVAGTPSKYNLSQEIIIYKNGEA